MPLPVVVLVGRPNVGKSTLFNRLTGRRVAIVEAEPGVTRDRLYGEVSWSGRRFRVIDTGGVQVGTEDPWGAKVRHQVEQAIAEADLVLLVVDARSGLLPADQEVAEWVRRARRPVLLVANKVETPATAALADFYALGLGEPWPISAEHGQGTGDLLDAVLARLPADSPAAAARAVGETDEDAKDTGAGTGESADVIRVAIVGRPNVGKSSLVNRILGSERVLVSEIPGTTRDPVDSPFLWQDHSFVLVDTAGLRRPGRVGVSLESLAFTRATQALERADVAVLVLDATTGVVHQDQFVAGLIQKAGRAVVIVVNKMDAAPPTSGWSTWQTQLTRAFDFFHYAPVLAVSALTGEGIESLLAAVVTAFGSFTMRLSPGRLGSIVQEALAVHAPPSRQGRPTRIHAVRQVQSRPPTFRLEVNDPQAIHFSYLRYLENTLRRAVPLPGSPVRWELRRKRASFDGTGSAAGTAGPAGTTARGKRRPSGP